MPLRRGYKFLQFSYKPLNLQVMQLCNLMKYFLQCILDSFKNLTQALFDYKMTISVSHQTGLFCRKENNNYLLEAYKSMGP